MNNIAQKIANSHINIVQDFFTQNSEDILKFAETTAESLQNGAKILICGNGGSACDAMHIAGELVGRFSRERPALAAIALSADSGIITAIGNDYSFEDIFSRQIEAFGVDGDILIALSTSGSSPNIIKSIKTAKRINMQTILFTGENGASAIADKLFIVPSKVTARIQEIHHLMMHIIADIIEEIIAKKEE